MKLKFEKDFLKDLKKLRNEKLKSEIISVIFESEKASNLYQINHIKKLTGYKTYYRIKLGDYRIGIEFVKEEIIFVVFSHRKDIYRKFP